MYSFKVFYESANKLGKDKWDAALADSEELRTAVELMTLINAEFPEGDIYIVGGVPRDLLMGQEVDDVDMLDQGKEPSEQEMKAIGNKLVASS